MEKTLLLLVYGEMYQKPRFCSCNVRSSILGRDESCRTSHTYIYFFYLPFVWCYYLNSIHFRTKYIPIWEKFVLVCVLNKISNVKIGKCESIKRGAKDEDDDGSGGVASESKCIPEWQ